MGIGRKKVVASSFLDLGLENKEKLVICNHLGHVYGSS
jgi:hypothetical protein